MAEREKMQDEQRVQEEQNAGQKEKVRIAVSRKEFYICVALLLILIYVRTGAILKNQRNEIMRMIANNSNYVSSRLDAIGGELYNLTDGTDQAGLLDSDVDISAVDWQNKTATLRLMAEPAEYQEGMTVTFFLSCDDGEAIPVAASAGEDYIYTAEQEIPFCEYVRVKVHIKRVMWSRFGKFAGCPWRMSCIRR